MQEGKSSPYYSIMGASRNLFCGSLFHFSRLKVFNKPIFSVFIINLGTHLNEFSFSSAAIILR